MTAAFSATAIIDVVIVISTMSAALSLVLALGSAIGATRNLRRRGDRRSQDHQRAKTAIWRSACSCGASVIVLLVATGFRYVATAIFERQQMSRLETAILSALDASTVPMLWTVALGSIPVFAIAMWNAGPRAAAMPHPNGGGRNRTN